MAKSKLDKPKACLICGYTKHITRHHIRPKRDGFKLTKLNTCYLCPNCHHEADMERHSKRYLQSLVITYWENQGYTLKQLQEEEAASIERIKDEINANHAPKPAASQLTEPDSA